MVRLRESPSLLLAVPSGSAPSSSTPFNETPKSPSVFDSPPMVHSPQAPSCLVSPEDPLPHSPLHTPESPLIPGPPGLGEDVPSRSPSPLLLERPALEEYIISEGRLVPAYSETPPIRLLYLQTVIGNIFGSRTVKQVTEQLTDGLDLLELGNILPLPEQNGYIPPAH
ncbi:hypothetical protein BDQ17DRAFT_1429301 [Cyathus striatus]|nr:hypothetical protein BDQ17DRAFT_1429301 [Cyathus striatus]